MSKFQKLTFLSQNRTYNYLNPVEEPGVVDNQDPVPPDDDVGDFLRLLDALVAEIVRVRLAALVIIHEDLVQASLLGHVSGRVDQLHPHLGFGAGARPVAGRDFGHESRHAHDRADHIFGCAQHLDRGSAAECC